MKKWPYYLFNLSIITYHIVRLICMLGWRYILLFITSFIFNEGIFYHLSNLSHWRYLCWCFYYYLNMCIAVMFFFFCFPSQSLLYSSYRFGWILVWVHTFFFSYKKFSLHKNTIYMSMNTTSPSYRFVCCVFFQIGIFLVINYYKVYFLFLCFILIFVKKTL